MLKFSLAARLRGHNKENWVIMFIHFFCSCPLSLSIKLNSNISKVAYWLAFSCRTASSFLTTLLFSSETPLQSDPVLPGLGRHSGCPRQPSVSVEGNGLCTSVQYKPTDSHGYLLYSSSHPSHVKNSIPYSHFLRLRRLCSEDSDFSLKSEEMCEFFDKRGYPASVVEAGHHRAQQIDRQSALQTSQKDGIAVEFHSLSHFTLTTTQ